ncbi:beta-lactamase domain-containing protein [Thermodesulfatator indicus DSM 15286]|uniref:Beta-lactamase domain-containing protein n=1 Tax=Thermodesulfatator indicus (strain DSM 15286 / JCM 11887 / CIR29812) TaxID=667014 RepID=F8AAM7_THEID|nr:MBL fold metallo-hydrolase [Thermodesulfatator indicus]AEH44299.1 beta-lactamase domain-containing protein [Thermodesulfatator indicus DSM 15286]
MRLTVLGSGTGWPRLERGAPGYLLQIEKENILLDIGPGTIPRILKTGLTLPDIDAIFLSHFHPDHVTDLIPFFFATRYSLGYNRQKPFLLVAGDGFSSFFEGLKSAFGKWVVPPLGLLEIQELSCTYEAAFMCPPFTVRSAPVKHNPESLAYRFEYQGKSLVYSGDTDYTENLVKLAHEADLLILECSAPEGMKKEGHLTPSLCGRIAGEARVKKLMLTHFYPPCDETDLISPCRAFYDGEIILAIDFLTFEL